jgi:hypothetical protein
MDLKSVNFRIKPFAMAELLSFFLQRDFLSAQ